MLRYVFAFVTPPFFPTEAKAFTCHKGGVIALVWTIVVLSFIEVGLVHLVVRQWSPPTAVLISLVSELSIVHLLGVANSLRCLPTYLTEDGVRVRVGVLLDQPLRWDEIARLETINGAYTKSPRVLRAALVSSPNVLMTLKTETRVSHALRGKQSVDAIELYLDDAAGFVREAKPLIFMAAR